MSPTVTAAILGCEGVLLPGHLDLALQLRPED